MPARRETDRGELSDGLFHFLTVGCWAAPTATPEEKFLIFTLSSSVLRSSLAPLQAVWRDVGALVKSAHPGDTFTELMLAGRLHRINTETWPRQFGRTRCREHPVLRFEPDRRDQR